MEIAWAELCGRIETGAPDEHGRGVKRGKSWGELRWKERDGSADEHGRGVKHGKISGGSSAGRSETGAPDEHGQRLQWLEQRLLSFEDVWHPG